MRIWINNPFDPLPGEGGRELRYWLLARALVAAGHEVVWWSSDFHHMRKRKRSVERVYRSEGFEVRLVPTQPYASNVSVGRWFSHKRYALRWERMARLAVLAGEVAKPDMIVVSMPPLGLFEAASRLRDAWDSRIAVDIQDVWPETFYMILPQSIRHWGSRLFARCHEMAARAYREADMVTAVCQRYADLAKEVGGRGDKPRVFRLGCKLPELQPWDEYGSGRALRLCYVGSLGFSYDIRTMVRGVCKLAAEGLPITLDVAGGGAPWGGGAGKAAERRRSPVRFHGYLSAEELEACMLASDVGIVPMRDASGVAVPNKVVDYAAHGLAMVCGLSGESLELLKEYQGGVGYEPDNMESFMAALRRYIGNAELLTSHRAGVRRMAEELFDERLIYPEMAAVLADMGGRGLYV